MTDNIGHFIHYKFGTLPNFWVFLWVIEFWVFCPWVGFFSKYRIRKAGSAHNLIACNSMLTGLSRTLLPRLMRTRTPSKFLFLKSSTRRSTTCWRTLGPKSRWPWGRKDTGSWWGTSPLSPWPVWRKRWPCSVRDAPSGQQGPQRRTKPHQGNISELHCILQ